MKASRLRKGGVVKKYSFAQDDYYNWFIILSVEPDKDGYVSTLQGYSIQWIVDILEALWGILKIALMIITFFGLVILSVSMFVAHLNPWWLLIIPFEFAVLIYFKTR